MKKLIGLLAVILCLPQIGLTIFQDLQAFHFAPNYPLIASITILIVLLQFYAGIFVFITMIGMWIHEHMEDDK